MCTRVTSRGPLGGRIKESVSLLPAVSTSRRRLLRKGVSPELFCLGRICRANSSRPGQADLKPLDRLQLGHNCVHTASQLPMRHLNGPAPATSKTSHWDTTPRQMQHTPIGDHLSLTH
nr:unnamed protein product [Spirometra erinaceieuropaei]